MCLRWGRALRSLDKVTKLVTFASALAVTPYCHAQLGGSGETVTLHTKLPAIADLTDPDVQIKVLSTAPNGAPLAAILQPQIQAMLQQADHRISTDSPHPATRIECNILTYTPYQVQQVVMGKDTTVKGKVYPAARGQVVTATVTLAYRAVSIKTGKPIDAAIVDAKLKENYGIPATKKPCKFCPEIPTTDIFKNAFSKPEPVPDAQTVTKRLIDEVAQKVAVRLVNTDKDIQVKLAKGKLEQEAKVAATGNWAKMLDDLKTTEPLSDPAADAYRLYDMGVAYEALGYKAPIDQAAPLFDQASEKYKAAVDAAPLEKGFLEPLVRIETAIVTVKTIQERSKNGGHISSAELTETKAADDKTAPAEPQTAKEEKKAVPPEEVADKDPDILNNAKIIRYTKKGMDDENLIAMINESHRVDFQLGGEAMDKLLDAKVSNKVIAAMRQKTKAAQATPVKRQAPPKAGGAHS